MASAFTAWHVGRMDGFSTIYLRSGGRETMLAATARAGRHEACGLLFGTRSGAATLISDVTVAVNIATDPARRFDIDPAHLFAAQRRARAGPEALLGVWHSHPGGTATPSMADAAGVVDRGWVWLIVAGAELAAWLPDSGGATDNGFRRLALSVIADA